MIFTVGIIANLFTNCPAGVFVLNCESKEIGYKTQDDDLSSSLNIIFSQKELPILNYEEFEDSTINYTVDIEKSSNNYVTAINYYLPIPYTITNVEKFEHDNMESLINEAYDEIYEVIENEIEE